MRCLPDAASASKHIQANSVYIQAHTEKLALEARTQGRLDHGRVADITDGEDVLEAYGEGREEER